MPTPSQRCPDCNKKMTYDPLLSIKGKSITSFWCTDCSQIIVVRKFKVNDVVTSVRQYIFQGHLP